MCQKSRMNASSGVAWALTAAVAAASSLRPALVSSHSVALTLLVSFYVLVFAQDERYTAKRPSSKRGGGAEATTGHRLLCEMGHGMVAEAAAAAGAALHEGSGNAAWDAAAADLVYTPLDVALPLGRL